MLKENTWYKIKSKDKLFYNTKNFYGYYICYKGLCISKKMLRFNKVFAKKNIFNLNLKFFHFCIIIL